MPPFHLTQKWYTIEIMLEWLTGRYRTLNTVHVSAEALRYNMILYGGLAPGVAVCPVIKSNAYGHGLLETAKIVSEENPAFLIVDSLYEAYELRKAGIKTDILILGYTFHKNMEGRSLSFHFAVCDMPTLRFFAKQKAPVHIKVNTGMNRMGFTIEELSEVFLYCAREKIDVAGIFTHFADADNPTDDSYTNMQCERFSQASALARRLGIEPRWIHAGASGGALKQSKIPEINMIRLGLGLYGISPFSQDDKNKAAAYTRGLKPALKVTSTVVGVQHLKKGDCVGYNGTFEATQDMVAAIVPFGYHEGLPRSLSNKGSLSINGVQCSIIGNISMNYTTVDASAVADVAIGNEVVVYSNNPQDENSIASLARKAGTIPYELLVRIAESARRMVE